MNEKESCYILKDLDTHRSPGKICEAYVIINETLCVLQYCIEDFNFGRQFRRMYRYMAYGIQMRENEIQWCNCILSKKLNS